jgi:hypothetical protein
MYLCRFHVVHGTVHGISVTIVINRLSNNACHVMIHGAKITMPMYVCVCALFINRSYYKCVLLFQAPVVDTADGLRCIDCAGESNEEKEIVNGETPTDVQSMSNGGVLENGDMDTNLDAHGDDSNIHECGDEIVVRL